MGSMNSTTQINRPVENFGRKSRQGRSDFIGWDQNGEPINADICETSEGFAVNVNFGSAPVSLVRRYVYATLSQAQHASIADEFGDGSGVLSYHGTAVRS